jgi:alkyldihydroxyacetonephosphate synthase
VALGSEGALGVFTELTLRIRRAPARAHAEGAVAPDFESGVAALRDLAQAGLCPTVLRLSDADETTATLAMSGPRGAARSALDAYLRFRGIRQPALAVLVWESADASVLRARRRAAWRLLSKHGFASLGASTGRAWERSRFGGPYLRDTLMDEGYLVETFETAAPWSRVSELSDALRRTVQSAIPGSYAMTHISHVYETGASIYVTVLASATADGLPIVPGEQGERWARAKRAIMDTIVAGGGTITHHHGVGRDHAPWLAREVSDEGLRVLRAVKDAVDPAGVMNPGVLVRPNGG